MASTEAEWLQALPAAIGAHTHQLRAGAAIITFHTGRLQLTWQVQPPRQIALIRLPRLWVRFNFQQVPPDQRHAFMQRFDLYMQRGGG